jgi:hypothetical protein
MPILGTRAGASVNGYGMFGKAFPTAIVTGGTLTSDSTYFYRTFTAGGTLSVTNGTVVADYALIGGGGGGFASVYIDFADGTGWGQAFFGGNGGAGGYRNANAQTLSGTYNITIGGGGAGGPDGGSPTAGTATTGFSLSASGGGVGGERSGGNGGAGGSGGGAGGQYGTQSGPPGATGSGGAGSQGGNGSSGYPGAGGGSGTTPGTTGNSGVNIFSMGTTYGIGGGNRGGNTGDGGASGAITIARYSGTNAGAGTAGANGIVIVRYLKSAVA